MATRGLLLSESSATCLATAAPDAPYDLTSSGVTSTSITLNWEDATSTPNEAGSYEVGISSDSGMTWTTFTVSAPASLYTFTSLSPSTTYDFRIRGVNCFGTGNYDGEAFTQATSSGALTPSWVLDFSTGEPWSNGTNYNHRSLRTAGTYVDSSGYIAINGANVCLQSENFTNTTTWPTSFLTVTANSGTAPDGSNTAFLLTEQVTGTASHRIGNTNIGFANQQMTYSCYFKKATTNSRDYAFINLFYISTSFSDGYVIFNLATGTVETTVTGLWTNVTSSITDVGNGWYRCVVTGTPSTGGSTARMSIGPATQTAISYTVTSGQEKSVLAWGAQLVAGSNPLPYSKTTTSGNGIPRLMHNSSGSRLGLLVEESRTNTMQFSEDPANAYYTKTNCSIDNNGGSFWTSPENTSDAVLLKQDTATGIHGISRAISGTDTCFSVFLKKQTTSGVGRYATLIIRRVSTEYYHATFDLDQGTVTQSAVVGTAITAIDRGIEDYGNGWYRCWVRGTQASASHTLYVSLATSGTPTMTSTGESYTGANSTDGVYIWGLMREANNTPPTSYIPTTTSSVIRPEEYVSLLDSVVTSWGDPGALVIHFYPPGQAGTLISTDDGANTQLGIEASSTTAARAFWSSGSTSTGTIGTSGVQKAVHYWNGTDSRFSINGSSVVSGTNDITSFSAIDFLTLGAEATDSGGSPSTYNKWANCIIRRVEWYAGTFSDPQVQQMTQ